MIARCDGYDVDTSLVGPATNQRRRLMNRDGADGRERWRPTVAVFGVLLSPSPLSFSSVDGEEEKKKPALPFFVFFRFQTTRKKERRVPKSIASLNNNNNNKKTSKKKTQIKKSSTDLVDAADAREDAGDLR